jgi:hypothetical protein
MAITLLNVGSGPNTGDGDFWRDAGIKANANFTSLQTSITTLQTSISGYAPLASPPFTGTPTAPTAAGGTNTTQLATTAFVTGALGSYLTTSVAAATYAVLGGSGAAFTVSPDCSDAVDWRQQHESNQLGLGHDQALDLLGTYAGGFAAEREPLRVYGQRRFNGDHPA